MSVANSVNGVNTVNEVNNGAMHRGKMNNYWKAIEKDKKEEGKTLLGELDTNGA